MTDKFSRRQFIKTGMSLGALSFLEGGKHLAGDSDAPAPSAGKMTVIASGNGLRATRKAMELLRRDGDPLDAVIAGVNLVEADPEDMSVGYGGLPNEKGEVELDSSVMYGPFHNAGAVAALKYIKTPSKVARLVMERSDHALLVGKGALEFALAHGFKKENLLTDRSRKIWLRWKENLSDRDNWFAPAAPKIPEEVRQALSTYGTINCLAINAQGDLAGVTTTSGLAFKIPGRVGDSPIIGAGLYVDNDVGAAGSTGRGEANILNCGSYQVVQFMSQGYSPTEACLKTLERIAQKTKLQPHLLNKDDRPRFGLNFYALNKKGEYGSASMWSDAKYALHDGKKNTLIECAYLYKRNP
ncbi:MAG: N(4)-(beta-N-acetylglucosaminyl)-L-asparaginase [Candidatus Aminicenantales bacterium]